MTIICYFENFLTWNKCPFCPLTVSMAGNFPLSLFWVTKGRVMIYVQNNNKYQPARLYHNSDPFVSVWEFYFWCCCCYHLERGLPFFVQMARWVPPQYNDLHSGDDLSHSHYYWHQNHSRSSPPRSELSSKEHSQQIIKINRDNTHTRFALRQWRVWSDLIIWGMWCELNLSVCTSS